MKLKAFWFISNLVNAIQCDRKCLVRDTKCLENCTRLAEDSVDSDGRYAILQQTRVVGINFRQDKLESVHGFNMNGHEVDFATSVEHNGEFYVIGGLVMDVISKVGSCGLQPMLELTDSLVMGKAASWNGKIWMCGDKDKPEACFSTDLTSIKAEPSSVQGHLTGGLVVTKDTNVLLRIAGYTRTTEVFDEENQLWHSNLIGNMTDRIRGFSTITTEQEVYLLGGFSDIQDDYTPNIWKWVSGHPKFDIVGKLLQTRMNSASVLDQNRIYTIGGLDNLNNEYFDLETENSTSLKTMSTPQIFSQLIPLASTQC